MIALLKAMDERRTIHDFSQLKNLLTSATEMLRMDPKTVHTTPHVRPSVCDVLFDVSLPGLNTMLAAQALLRSSSPSNALSAIITCLTPKVNPFCSLSASNVPYRFKSLPHSRSAKNTAVQSESLTRSALRP